MAPVRESLHAKRSGTVLIMSMIFVMIFSALAVSMATLSGVNVQLASNQHKLNSALSAALSGLECGRYIIANTPLPSTGHNYVTEASSTLSTDIADFKKIIMPLTRRIFPNLIANEIVGVQPMAGPVGLAYALRFKSGDNPWITVKRGDVSMAIIIKQTGQSLKHYGFYSDQWHRFLMESGFETQDKRVAARKKLREWWAKNKRKYEGVEKIELPKDAPENEKPRM